MVHTPRSSTASQLRVAQPRATFPLWGQCAMCGDRDRVDQRATYHCGRRDTLICINCAEEALEANGQFGVGA